MVLAVTASPAFTFPELTVWVKITGMVVWPGSVIARLAGADAEHASRPREREERKWMLMVVDLLDAVTTHWSIHPPYRTLTFSLRFPDICGQAA